jgi:transglutaminase-like putative cysteine protease
LELGNRGNMVYRTSRLIGSAAIALALVRLMAVVRPTETGAPWQIVLGAAALLAAGVTWAALAYRAPAWLVILGNAVGLAIMITRVAAPQTALLGVFPGADTPAALLPELTVAVELARFAGPPLVPVAGLVALLVVLFWVMGVLLVWATAVRRPLLGLVPPLLLGLQLATVDRLPARPMWIAAGVVLIAASLAAVAHDERLAGSGRLRRPTGQPAPAEDPVFLGALTGLVAAVALIGAVTLASYVPADGSLDWRTQGPLGSGVFGGASYNLFAGIKQTLVEQTEVPLFRAAVSGDVPPGQLYWRMITLDSFDGSFWRPSEQPAHHPESGQPFEDRRLAFGGRTTEVRQVVVVDNLRQAYLPVLYSPVAFGSEEELLRRSFSVRPDGSIRYDLLSRPGLTYEAASLIPTPTLADLATVDGELSPMFAEAAEAGAFDGSPVLDAPSRRPAAVAAFLELPELDPRIERAAADLTAGATTEFEKGILLERFFRDEELFTYTVDIDPGHSAEDLADWLFTEDSPNYRKGYCEQFATAMAVMARTVDVPSRVVLGFTPGETGADGVITVRQKNAHAWVELWVDGKGWVRFDPTPRSDGANPATTADIGFDPFQFVPEEGSSEPGATPGDPTPLNLAELLARAGELEIPEVSAGGSVAVGGGIDLPVWFWLLGGLTVMVAIIPAIKLVRRRRRMARLERGDISAAWAHIVDHLGDLGSPVPDHLTPLELAAGVGPPLRPLAEVYTAATFGRDDVTSGEVGRAVESMRSTERHLKRTHTRWRRFLGWLRP